MKNFFRARKKRKAASLLLAVLLVCASMNLSQPLTVRAYTWEGTTKTLTLESDIDVETVWGSFHEVVEKIVFADGVSEIPVAGVVAIGTLKSIEFAESVTKIGQDAFKDCSSLSSVEIPSKMQSIENNAFEGCDSLKVFKYPAGLNISNIGLTSSAVTISYSIDATGKKTYTCDNGNHDIVDKGNGVYGCSRCDYVNPITQHPSDATVEEGGEASFTVAATGSGDISYQWEVSKDAGNTWTKVDGETNATYRLVGVETGWSGWQYRCAVTNSEGTVYSDAAVLTVNAREVTPPEPESGVPFIRDDNGKEGWEVIQDALKEMVDRIRNGEMTPGETMTVDMNGGTTVPKEIFETIAGEDIMVIFDMGNGITWTVNGKSVTGKDIGDIDFGVNKGTNTIPVDVINNVTGERYSINITLAYEGEFGFTAILSINLEQKNAGLYANLFYYNVAENELEYICADQIDGEGNAELTFTHASDYTIVIDEAPMEPEETDSTQKPSDTGDTQNSAKADADNQRMVDAPQTGDVASWWWILLLVAAAGIGGYVYFAGKKKYNHE